MWREQALHLAAELCWLQQLQLNGESAARPREDLHNRTAVHEPLLGDSLTSGIEAEEVHACDCSLPTAETPYLVHLHLDWHADLKLPGQIDPGFLFNVCRYQPANCIVLKLVFKVSTSAKEAAAHSGQTEYIEVRTRHRFRQCQP